MIKQNRWVERGTKTMFLVGSGGKIIAEIHCIDYPMIWTFKNDKYISKEAAQEAAQNTLMPPNETMREDADEIARLRDVLRRLRQWDTLDMPESDGNFWKREIDAVLKPNV